MEGKAGQQVLEMAGHVASVVRKQREANAGAQFFLVFIPSKTSAHRTVLPTFRMALPARLTSSEALSQTYPEVFPGWSQILSS